MIVAPVLTSLMGKFVTLMGYIYQAAMNLLGTVLATIATISATPLFLSLLTAHLEGGRRGQR